MHDIVRRVIKMAMPIPCRESLRYAKNILILTSLIHFDVEFCKFMSKNYNKSLKIVKVITWVRIPS